MSQVMARYIARPQQITCVAEQELRGLLGHLPLDVELRPHHFMKRL
jgi:hypothetical protein